MTNEKHNQGQQQIELSVDSDAIDAGNSASASCNDGSSERPRHDALIRKALENPRVAKEFFEMHLPKEIKAMFSSHTLKMEKESFVEADLKHDVAIVFRTVNNRRY
jgi:hypothetical protein